VELILGFRFGQADNPLAFFELTPLLEEFDTFKPFQNTALRLDRAFTFQTRMLTHKI